MRTVNLVASLCVLAVMCGCASHGTRVRCDGRLEPINQPAMKSEIPAKGGNTQGTSALEQRP